MLKRKRRYSQLTCSYCSKIFKDPIELPCGDCICRQHLSQSTVVKANGIKCKLCNEEYQVKDNEFKSNNQLKSQIESHSYLSKDEKSFKQKLEESIQKFFEFYDEYVHNRNKSESDVFDHFQELRFQVDEHRERLKERIDDIALAMIDVIKKHEAMYLKELNENFPSFDNSVSLEKKSNELEDTYRDPNLLIETIEEMQSKQDESLKDIQLKLNQMTKVNDSLEATNKFKPNLSLFNQTKGDTSLFGSIRLCQYSNTNPFDSEIFTDERQMSELIDLCEFSTNEKWSLLYRGTRDGFEPSDFHSKCDGHSSTLTIFKAAESAYIFGGFTTVSWDSSDDSKSDPNAFIFSLTNKESQPLKMKIDPNEHHRAIFCSSYYGPTFSQDIILEENFNTTMYSLSDLGNCYKHPQYAKGTNEAQSFLAGSFYFQLDEIEVYQKE
jgi:hypothetical protein